MSAAAAPAALCPSLPSSAPPPLACAAPALSADAQNPAIDGYEFGSLSEILHAAQRHVVGRSAFSEDQHAEYIPGNLPIIISVPHGGYAAPLPLPDRTGGNHEPDIHTQELGRLLGDAFAIALGVPGLRPHVVISRLRRGKLDMNRNQTDAAQHDVTRSAWASYHAFVRRAKREIVRGRSSTNPMWRDGAGAHVAAAAASSPAASAASAAAASPSSPSPAPSSAWPSSWHRGLVLDLHGQSHDARNQLGYILSQAELSALSDETLDASREMADKSSVRCAVDPPPCAVPVEFDNDVAVQPGCEFGSLTSREPTRLSSIVRGAASLGAMLERRGHPCVPSPSSPHAGDTMYFNGGYNSYVHGSSVLGGAQRKKERAAAAAAAAAGVDSASASLALSTLDPDPPFSALFDQQLEERCFLAIQVESAYERHRDSDDNMHAFARNLADALIEFVSLHVLGPGEAFPTSSMHPTTTNADPEPDLARSELYFACMRNDSATVKSILASGGTRASSVECTQSLDKAVVNGCAECVQVMVDYGARMSEGCDEIGKTPVHWCCEFNEVATLRLLWSLQERGALRLPLRDSQQRTLLMSAVLQGSIDVATFLCEEARVDVEESDEGGKTALIHATSSGNLACVQLLLRCGAAVDHADSDGDTPLIWSAWQGQRECLDFLLAQAEPRAQIDHQDVNGLTALHQSVRWGHSPCAHALLAHGANVTLTSKAGSTAWSLAVSSEQPDNALVAALEDAAAAAGAADAQ